ncbi:MAG: flagellar hook-associated protein FlgK [Acidobacteriota bacterium]|nr:flagellar hook-associated protein FlgK [Acidobacteriota bacterium]
MATLTSLIDASTAALQADQVALDATSNNVANQGTAGYTRQTVQFQSADVVSLGNGQYSTVVTAQAVSQRNRVLEQMVQQQAQAQSQSSAIAAAYQQIEAVFQLSSSSSAAAGTQLGVALNGFFSSLTSLSANPSDPATQQSVLSSAQTLVGAFNGAASQLTQITDSINQTVPSVVGQVNALTKTIAGLNQQIAQLSPGQDAGTLEDQRQAAIAQLSQYIGLDQISSSGNGITLATTSGTLLVGDATSYPLGTVAHLGNTDVLDASGNDITASLTGNGGQLGGMFRVRSQVLPGISSALDTLAYNLATAVNAQNQSGVNSSGVAGLALFGVSGVAGAAGSLSLAASSTAALAPAAAGQGSAGNTNAQALAGLANTPLVGGQSASGALAALLGQIGASAAGASQDASAQQARLTTLTTQRDSYSAVSLDQEAANLTQYQRSYEAAAKVFTIADTMMAAALNLGVATAVS